MNTDTVNPMELTAPETDDIAVLYLRGIESFLQAAQDLTSTVMEAHEGGSWMKLEYRLFLAYLSIAEARTTLWPSDQSIDSYNADMRDATGYPTYIKVSNNRRSDAYHSLDQAISDLEVAINIVCDKIDENPSHDREYRMLIDAQSFAQSARYSIPNRVDNAVVPVAGPVPF